ncbi:MAG: cysteine desulfurase family protein, partial [Rectinema sp.]
RFVYMDYNATTPLRPEVRDAMVEALDVYANASSMHESGRRARVEIEDARVKVAALVGARDPGSIYFTSGGSESNNTVFATMYDLGRKATVGKVPRRKIITTSIEHPCVLNSAKHLEEEGFPVVFLPVDSDGRIDMARLEAELDETTLLVSGMASNNEIGTIQDIPRIAKMARAAGALMHTDATQSVGKVPVSVEAWGVDYLTMSCHKIYGPKGIGALYVRPMVPVTPLIRGGHQEKGVRAGTYNNLGIIGFGKAAELALHDLETYRATVGRLRNSLRDKLAAAIPDIRVNGHPDQVLPNTLNISFPGAEGEAILLSMDIEGIQVSTGSACASGSLEPSHVLMATGVGPELAHGSIRFSLGRNTTEAEVEYVAEKLPPIIARLRKMSTISSSGH